MLDDAHVVAVHDRGYHHAAEIPDASLSETLCEKPRDRGITQVAKMSIDPYIARTHSWRITNYFIRCV